MTNGFPGKRPTDEIGFGGMGAKPHSPTGKWTPKIYGLVRSQFLVAKISTPGNRKWEIFKLTENFGAPWTLSVYRSRFEALPSIGPAIFCRANGKTFKQRHREWAYIRAWLCRRLL